MDESWRAPMFLFWEALNNRYSEQLRRDELFGYSSMYIVSPTDLGNMRIALIEVSIAANVGPRAKLFWMEKLCINCNMYARKSYPLIIQAYRQTSTPL